MRAGDIDTQKLELENRQRLQKRINLYHTVFCTKEGRELLADLKKVHGFDEAVFTRINLGDYSGFDDTTAKLKDGARGVIVEINRLLAMEATGEANLKPKKPVKK